MAEGNGRGAIQAIFATIASVIVAMVLTGVFWGGQVNQRLNIYTDRLDQYQRDEHNLDVDVAKRIDAINNSCGENTRELIDLKRRSEDVHQQLQDQIKDLHDRVQMLTQSANAPLPSRIVK